MKNWIILSWLTLSLIAFTGIQASAEPVENFEYNYWASFKVGSSVKIKSTIQRSYRGQQRATEFVITLIIKEISPDKVDLEGYSEIQVGGKTLKTPELSVVKKMIDSPIEYQEKGQESVSVEAGTFMCRKTERIREIFGEKIKLTTWWSPEVPGGVVKTIVEADDTSTRKVRELIHVDIKK